MYPAVKCTVYMECTQFINVSSTIYFFIFQLSDDNFLKEKVFMRLTSRDSENFWTSGQWMTERKGGSDVG